MPVQTQLASVCHLSKQSQLVDTPTHSVINKVLSLRCIYVIMSDHIKITTQWFDWRLRAPEQELQFTGLTGCIYVLFHACLVVWLKKNLNICNWKQHTGHCLPILTHSIGGHGEQSGCVFCVFFFILFRFILCQLRGEMRINVSNLCSSGVSVRMKIFHS